MTDWEARALPTEARCRAWAERGGRWVVSHYSGLMGAPFLTIVFPESGRVQPQKDDVIWRPWMGQNPTPWSDFYADTHPPIPEGWEKVGEWRQRNGESVWLADSSVELLTDNGLLPTRIAPSQGEWYLSVRRLPPPVDWGDVPRGVELDADRGGAMLVTSDGHAVTHGIVWFSAGVWHSGNVSERADQRHPSLPAAIVALTGRRNG